MLLLSYVPHTMEVTHAFVSEGPEPQGQSSSERLQYASICPWEWAAFPSRKYLALRTQRHLPGRMFSLVKGDPRCSTFSFTLEKIFLHLFGKWALKSFTVKLSKPSHIQTLVPKEFLCSASVLSKIIPWATYGYFATKMCWTWLNLNKVFNLNEF